MEKDLYNFTPEEVERSQLLALEVFERLVLKTATSPAQLRQLDGVIARADEQVAADLAQLSPEERAGEVGAVLQAYRSSRGVMRAALQQQIARLSAESV